MAAIVSGQDRWQRDGLAWPHRRRHRRSAGVQDRGGLVGSTYARFAHFVRGRAPSAPICKAAGAGSATIRSALSVLALLGLLAFQVSTGLFAQ